MALRKATPKQDYADLFNVHRTTISRWINNNPALKAELETTGWEKGDSQHYWTPKQVAILNKYLR
jgi:DNA-binding LacI/PurR family transcriptional regulator